MVSPTKDGRRFVIVVALLAAVFALAAVPYVRRYALPAPSVAAIYSCFLWLLVLVVAPACATRNWLVTRVPILRTSLLLLALWLSPYLIYAAGTRDFRLDALLRLLIIAVPLLLIYSAFPVKNLDRLAWQDAVAAALLISAVLFHQLRGIWNVPVNLDFMARLFLISVAAGCWIFVRPVPGLGYEFSVSPRVLKAAAFNFSAFAVIALPLGLALHFIQWNPQWRGAKAFCLDYLEIFLFIAWLEELFFRGFLQNLISNSLQSAWRGQLIVSILFGFSHIFHAPVPNWRYVALASIAGWFYGAAFRNGGNLMASSLVHALVDTAWRTWFGKG